jgi:hypothetical protein
MGYTSEKRGHEFEEEKEGACWGGGWREKRKGRNVKIRINTHIVINILRLYEVNLNF